MVRIDDLPPELDAAVALAEALHALDEDHGLDGRSALALWRDAAIPPDGRMSPAGLALAAARRGVHARLICTHPDGQGALEAAVARQARHAGVLVEDRAPTAKDVVAAAEARTPALVVGAQGPAVVHGVDGGASRVWRGRSWADAGEDDVEGLATGAEAVVVVASAT